jgi:hypothetical protein
MSAERLTGLARHVYHSTIRLNSAWAKLQAAIVEERAAGASDQDVMAAIDRAADTDARRKAQAQVERVLVAPRREPEPEGMRVARDIVEGRRPVR